MYKYQKQKEKEWVDDKGLTSHVTYLPGFKKLMDRNSVAIAKVAIDIEKRNQALKAQIDKMITDVKAAMVKDFPGGSPTIRTFTSFDKSVKIEAAQGAVHEFDEAAFIEAKDHFREFIKADTGDENKLIKDSLAKIFTEDQTDKSSIEVVMKFSEKFIEKLKENEHFQNGVKAMKGIYKPRERTYFKILVMTDSGMYKKVSLNLNDEG